MKMPGFTASSLLKAGWHPNFENVAVRVQAVPIKKGSEMITMAEEGGPGTVPPGYGRACVLKTYWICVGNRCWQEFYEECTTYPLPRAS